MASLARIPFRPADEQVINTLNGWMLFLAIMHFVGAAFIFLGGCFGAFGAITLLAVNPLWGILTAVQMLLVLVLGVGLVAEGAMLVQARSALSKVVASDVDDQKFLSTAFQRLKFFFMLELVWFALNVFFALLGLVTALVAPEMAGGGLGGLGGMGGGAGYDPGGSW